MKTASECSAPRREAGKAADRAALHRHPADDAVPPGVEIARRRSSPLQNASQIRKGTAVSATVLYMSMSLDGFIAGPNAGPGNGLGDGGHRLHEWALPGAGADHKGSRPT